MGWAIFFIVVRGSEVEEESSNNTKKMGHDDFGLGALEHDPLLISSIACGQAVKLSLNLAIRRRIAIRTTVSAALGIGGVGNSLTGKLISFYIVVARNNALTGIYRTRRCLLLLRKIFVRRRRFVL
jgi:hypothetical protein